MPLSHNEVIRMNQSIELSTDSVLTHTMSALSPSNSKSPVAIATLAR